MEGHLKVIVMTQLSEKPMSGYALIKRIEEVTGCWKPSAGSMYPLLSELRRKGLINLKQEKRQKLYFLTSEGRKHLKQLEKMKHVMVQSMLAKIRIFDKMPKEDTAAFLLEFVKKTDEKGFPFRFFKEIAPELKAVRRQILRLYIQGKISRKEKEIRKILTATWNELKKL